MGVLFLFIFVVMYLLAYIFLWAWGHCSLLFCRCAGPTVLLRPSRKQALSSYVIDVMQLKQPTNDVVDFAWLPGFEPTLLLLHETLPAWTGRTKVTRDTRVISMLSLNMAARLHPVIWSVVRWLYICLTLCL